jgi:peptidoglycan/LPS O-acetylase OafA/YrhL
LTVPAVTPLVDRPPAVEAPDAVPRTRPGAAPVVRQGSEQRLRRLESLRGLAALAVIEYHVLLFGFIDAHAHVSRLDATFAGLGPDGLFLFFCLSGYLIYRPFARRDHAAGPAINLRRYALNRAVRVLPLYYTAVVVLLLVTQHGGSGEQWWRFLLMAQSYSHHTVETVDGPMWSLIVEVQFYVLLPLLAVLLAAVAQRRAAITAGLLTALAALSLAVHHEVTRVHPDELMGVSLLANFVFFVPGMLVAVMETRWRQILRWLPRLENTPSSAVLVVALAIWLLSSQATSVGEALKPLAAMVTVAACVLPLRHGRGVQLLDWRPLAVLGVASYSLYIWHLPVLRAMIGAGWLPFGYAGDVVVAYCVCVPIALLSYRLVEAPWLRLRRRWSASTAEAQAAAGAA